MAQQPSYMAVPEKIELTGNSGYPLPRYPQDDPTYKSMKVLIDTKIQWNLGIKGPVISSTIDTLLGGLKIRKNCPFSEGPL